jgi:glycosyltransferase involved in cell wall biosynthesis
MHILHTESSCGWGGQEIRILTESAGMLERGHSVSLIAPETSNIFREAGAYGIEPIALPIERKRLPALLAMRRWLGEHAHAIDIINTHSSTDSWLVAVSNLLLRDPAPVVRTRHVSSPINNQLTTRWLYQTAVKHIAVTGEPLRQQLVRDNGFRPDSMTSVPTGIDLDRFQPRDKGQARKQLGLDADKFIVGILATLRSWKGHSYLMDAIASLEDLQNIQLLIVGDGPYREKLEQHCDRLKINHKVTFVGQQDNPESWLNAMDLFVLPSYGDEGVSQAVMQAMASRLPVIATPVGGMLDAVEDEVTGLLVKLRNGESIARAIRRLVDDERLRDRLGEAGNRFARERFSRQLMLDRMESIFMQYRRQR